MRALFVGAICLLKGAPYLLEAARLLGDHVEFRAVGTIQVSESASRDFRGHVQLTGRVPRSEARRHFDWADVFVFPSLCEGSATVCYEALAAGLPVITTPNAGSVVRHKTDGFVVPIRNPEAIAEKLDLLASNHDLLVQMSRNAAERSKEFTLEQYGRRLIAALQGVSSRPALGTASVSH